MARNGQMMEIIEYRSSGDIDVMFEDGTIVRERTYALFQNGEIKNPNIPVGSYANVANKGIKNRVGERYQTSYGMWSGMWYEIVNYTNAQNIDVKFEDGVVLMHRSYFHAKNGKIAHPKMLPNGIEILEFAYRLGDDWYYTCRSDDWDEPKVLPIKEICPEPIMTQHNVAERRPIYGSLKGEKSVASNGMVIECIEDNGSKDITVRFEDGALRYHQRRESFLIGHIRHPSKQASKSKRDIKRHIGEIWPDRCGRKVKIVEYYSNSNVTIEYEDGTRLEDKEYRIIKKGADLYPKSSKGDTKIARNGMKMTIIDDTIWNKVKVQFEDGTIVENCTRSQFYSGAIKHPTMKEGARSHKQHQERMHTKIKQKNGLIGEVVGYTDAKNIDVLFENGLLTKKRDWNSFYQARMGMPKHVGTIHIEEFAYRLDDDWFYIVTSPSFDEPKIMSVKQMYEHENTDHASINAEQTTQP